MPLIEKHVLPSRKEVALLSKMLDTVRKWAYSVNSWKIPVTKWHVIFDCFLTTNAGVCSINYLNRKPNRIYAWRNLESSARGMAGTYHQAPVAQVWRRRIHADSGHGARRLWVRRFHEGRKRISVLRRRRATFSSGYSH